MLKRDRSITTQDLAFALGYLTVQLGYRLVILAACYYAVFFLDYSGAWFALAILLIM